MNLTIIVAISENNIIGSKGKIPWKIKEDMNRFKQLTLDHPIIMGRKTYESIPKKFRPLPRRKNIILSNTFEQREGIYIARNLNDSLILTENQDAYIIGGTETYKIFLPLVNYLEITKVHANYDGDAFFPIIQWENWDLINQEEKISEEGVPFSFLSYKKTIVLE
jgi:dihydrofolate reductase